MWYFLVIPNNHFEKQTKQKTNLKTFTTESSIRFILFNVLSENEKEIENHHVFPKVVQCFDAS